jgi:hypothetical protein
MDTFGFFDETGGASPGAEYPRELVDAVWSEAEGIDGNDPELWRKDEFGAWIYRFDYGRHGSNFGWQIAARGRDLRPVHWQNAVEEPRPAGTEDEEDGLGSFDLFS